MPEDPRDQRRADFLDGCGSLSLSEVQEWARELTPHSPHPALSPESWDPGTPMYVALLFPYRRTASGSLRHPTDKEARDAGAHAVEKHGDALRRLGNDDG